MTPLPSLPLAMPLPSPVPKSEHEVRRQYHPTQALLLLLAQIKALK